MPKVRSFAYRRVPTPKGLEKIEKNQVELYDVDMYANFNTGVLEQYLDEDYRVTSFAKKQWFWRKVLLGLCIGTIFTIINQYVGLRIGMIVGGNWFLVYIIGLVLRWKPAEINIAAGCSTGASATCTGFVFTYPAIFLLAYHAGYLGAGGERLITPEVIPTISLAIAATMIAAFLGVLYFTIFRKIWLIEDPLPVPGFEGTIKMMDMAHDISKGAAEKAIKTLKKFVTWLFAGFGFAFLRDYPLLEEKSVFDKLFAGKWYAGGDVMQPYETDVYTHTHLGFSLSPMMVAIGWFMRARIAFILALGTFLTWFVIVPIALLTEFPIYHAELDAVFKLENIAPNLLFGYPSSAIVAYAKVAIPIGIGVILGGGVTAIIKMSHIFKSFAQDIVKLRGAERKDFIQGRGWYDWPFSHIPILMIVVLLGVGTVFALYGYPIAQSFALSIILVVVALFISAIAVKTMGEIRTTPVSACSFIVLIFLILIFYLLGTEFKTLLVMALLGTAVFGTTVTLSSDIIYDFKVGMYCRTKPYNLIKGELLGAVAGTVVAVFFATYFSIGLAKGELQLIAPQARAFAGFSQAVIQALKGTAEAAPWDLIIMGFFIGIFAEIMTGMGTSFGLGLYFPLPVTLAILLGGVLRDIWEKKWLEPKAKAERWDDRTKTTKVIDTYIICIGIVVGEALLGTIVAIYYVVTM
jgi:uncharacterized oligopeptide transporter (OPT) family protein